MIQPHIFTAALVKQVNYPKLSPTRPHYDSCRNRRGGYGGLLSATFFSMGEAIKFYDNLDTAKGPSLGTNFTLRCALDHSRDFVDIQIFPAAKINPLTKE